MSAVGIVLVYVLAFVIRGIRPNSPFFEAMKELRDSPENVIFSPEGGTPVISDYLSALIRKPKEEK